ncbi:YdcF family protein [Paenibacillus ginsengarvi]|uniref:YdcF family protein n=1 Tax=Paenibacillus ginsengarvi TaxID=400777 RepID=A0A3B0CIH0_9BACL|nr:YdcF family protein [Paenibacillus ginsengarvi]RKN84109.1 YdcF family protein [Paenibacillus ginsengarvi]
MNRSRHAYSPQGGKRWLRRLIAFVSAAVLLGLIWVGYVQWRIRSVQDMPLARDAQVAIVLGASLRNDKPSPALRERLEQAYKLYEIGGVSRLIVSGGLDDNGATITEAEGMKRYLIGRGIPEEAILEEGESTSTYENLLFSKRIMDREGWTRPIIVTHQYHGARSMDIADFIGLSGATASLADSEVIWMPWHKGRETLAFAKWYANKLLLSFRPTA